jgi:predicted secreted protein with PEFG-CTERM motif
VFKKSAIALIVLLLIPLSNFAVHGQSDFDTSSMGLQMPTIEMTPTSGQPGTEIQIKVTNMPTVPEGIDPRLEFFVYLPFVSAIGHNVPLNCDGESCFALYSFDEISQNKLAPKTISLVLFSTTNAVPVTQAGLRDSICDLKINGETIERYSETCTDIDQPVGNYEIKFGWGIQQSKLYDVRETLIFTVTEKELIKEERQQDEDELAMSQYQEGLISESEFEQILTDLGYDAEEIRQSKALIGKLEHQEGFKTPLKGPIAVQGTDRELTYTITGGVITQVSPDTESESLIINIDSLSNGTLFLQLPRDVIDAKFGEEDDDFFVLVDGLETEFDEAKTANDRTLTVAFPQGTEEIEVIGTFVVPEFGAIVILILVVSIFSIVFVSKSKLGFYAKI